MTGADDLVLGSNDDDTIGAGGENLLIGDIGGAAFTPDAMANIVLVLDSSGSMTQQTG